MASVVPNYFPTIRVVEYNISGVEDSQVWSETRIGDLVGPPVNSLEKSLDGVKKPKGPSKTTPPGPAYSPQTFTWLGYQQLFANLTEINRGDGIGFNFELEYRSSNDTVYGLRDMTVRSYLDLARRIGQKTYKCSEVAAPDQKKKETTSRKKHKKKSKKHKKKKKEKYNPAWYAFVSRAFVGAIGEEEIRDSF